MTILLETFLGVAFFLVLGLVFFAAFAMSISGTSVDDIQDNPIVRQRPRETFTEEETLMWGVDTRDPNARNQIQFSKWAQANGMTPMQRYESYVSQLQNRPLFSDPDDVIDAEVVDDPPRLLPRSDRSRKLLGG